MLSLTKIPKFDPTLPEIQTRAALIAHRAGLRLWDLDPETQSKYCVDAEIALRLHHLESQHNTKV